MPTPSSTTKPYSIDTTKPVLVTGATGYIAGVLIKDLLDAGLTVHTTVRNLANKEELQYLQDAADNSQGGGKIKFFEATLTDEGSFADAMEGCQVVFHVASPVFIMEALHDLDPIKDVIEPAVKGTENVLRQATRTPTVRRVVLTSSETAIFTDARECDDTSNGIFTEEIWNRSASATYAPYHFSKTLAEQKAWVIAGGQRQWTLVTILPSCVIGPGLNYRPSSESHKFVLKVGGGEFKSLGTPNYPLSFVDVRDVSAGHMAAAWIEEAEGRYIVAGYDSSIPELGRAMGEDFIRDYPVCTHPLFIPKFLLVLVAPLLGSGVTRRSIRNNLNLKRKLDNSKSVRELGTTYRPLEDSIQQHFQQLIDAGAVKKK
jgi:nucleoside-diphosphate-sugar epimerase